MWNRVNLKRFWTSGSVEAFRLRADSEQNGQTASGKICRVRLLLRLRIPDGLCHGTDHIGAMLFGFCGVCWYRGRWYRMSLPVQLLGGCSTCARLLPKQTADVLNRPRECCRKSGQFTLIGIWRVVLSVCSVSGELSVSRRQCCLSVVHCKAER